MLLANELESITSLPKSGFHDLGLDCRKNAGNEWIRGEMWSNADSAPM